MTTIHDILAEFRDAATSTTDLGDRFERLMLGYFKTDPIYRDLFSEVWMWLDFPKRGGEADTGIDLVAEKSNGDGYCAIQCKCYQAHETLQKQNIDSFFTTSGKEIYTSRLIVTTTDRWSKNLLNALKDQQIPVTKITLSDLVNSPIDWSQFSLRDTEKLRYTANKISLKITSQVSIQVLGLTLYREMCISYKMSPSGG